MKKILALLIVLVLVLSVFASCKTTPEDNNNDNGTTPPTDNNQQDNNTEGSTLEDAKTVLRDLYKEKLTTTAVAFSVVTQVMVGEDAYEIVWSTNNEKITVGEPDAATKTVTISVPTQSPEKIDYVLTATIKAADGSTLDVTFNVSVPKFEVNSHADYMAAAKDDELTIMGVVVAINSVKLGNKYNHVFLADTTVDGGYYCYKVTNDPAELGVEVGMTVAVTGKMSPYSGMQEIIDGQVSILDSTIKTVETLDITEKFAAGADLAAYVGLRVSIKGVSIGTQDLEKDTSQYLYFSIGEQQGYVRTYVTDFPTNLQANRDEVKATIDADHLAHFGYKADVEGILILYSSKPYLIPTSVTPFTNYEEVVKTPAEKVDAELGDLKLDASVSADKVIDLLLTGKYYDDVTFTWATSDETNAAIADGKLTLIVPDATTTVTITVTATCGDVTETKEFTIKLSKSITPLDEAAEIGAAKDHNTYTDEKYIIAGIIKEVYNTQYGNMYLVDEHGHTFTVYGTYSADGADRYDAMANKPVAGDYVVISGVLGQYNGTAQMKNGWIQSFTAPITIPEANELGNTFEKDNYTDDKKVITGEITEVQNTTYGNVVIKDAAGNSILVYGLYNANGTVRYDAMETKPAVGDTITVLGIIGKYNAPQMKNGWLIGYAAGATGDTHEHTFVEGKCECGADDPNYQPPSGDVTPGEGGVVSAPVADTAYKFGMVQVNLNDGKVYYLKGGMDGYYMATSANAAEAIDVYLEATTGGYYLYTIIDGTKTYINMVVSGTHVNGAYEATASTVYTFDAESKTVIANVNDADYWFGTRNDKTYTTVGPCATSYNGFYCQFYTVDAGNTGAGGSTGGGTGNEGGETPDVTGGIVFDFGANGTAGTHNDGVDIGTGKEYTSGNYTLTLTDAYKAYDGGVDKAGNSILKLGTGSVAGTVTFVVPDEVTSVVVYAARYKNYDNNNIIVINGTSYNLTKNSDDGEYEAITIDTTTTKTVTIASSLEAGKPRCVVNTIIWITGEGTNA